MSVRVFTKTVHAATCVRIEDGVCVFEDDRTGEVRVIRASDRLVVVHDISIGGPSFLVDKRAQKAFVAGLHSVGFVEKVTQ